MLGEKRKGISELVAAMLMIVITIAAATLFYVYSSGLLGTLQGTQPQQPYVDQLTLEYYDWTTLNTLTLYVRNVGSSIVSLVRSNFFVGGTLITTASRTIVCVSGTVSSTVTATTASVAPQVLCRVTLTIPGGLTISSGLTYVVKIATPSGSVSSFSCIAGRSTGSFS